MTRTWFRKSILFALFFVALMSGLSACSSQGDGTGGDETDTMDASASEISGDLTTDHLVPGDIEADNSEADLDTHSVDVSVAPVASPVEPELVEIEQWLVAFAMDYQNDPVGDAVEAGTFQAPAGPGVDGLGVEWSYQEAGENGSLGFAGYGVFWAFAQIDTPEPTGLVVRADKVYRVFVNGAPQPGDPYRSRMHRVPFMTRAGENDVLVMAVQAGSDAEVELWTTPHELFLNNADLVLPDFVVGDGSDQYIGVPVLNLTDEPALDVTARVLSNDSFAETTLQYPALSAGATTQVAFRLEPKAAATEADLPLPITVMLESPSLEWSYEYEFEVTTVSGDEAFRRSFLSEIDQSAQYYGVRRPSSFDAEESYALTLSLHGAGVEARGQAAAYSPKDWAYVIAPTNRRRFGFDWEEWGRLDGVEVLEHAAATFGTDPERVYVTGHSMGGHGTWQFGALLTGRFAVVGPSAGWSSFYSYGGSTKPTGPFARARASSDTLNYVSNLARRAVYVIHGDADDNVPISEAYLMSDAVSQVTDDFFFHIEPGAGHWWDGDVSEGADCVDWPPLFDLMKDRLLNPYELDFTYTTPSPWVNPTHSFVTIRSELSPMLDCTITSAMDGDEVTLTTENVRGMVLTGGALLDQGVMSLVVDEVSYDIPDGPLEIGPQTGKNEEVHGPFNQVFQRPFCFAYPDDGPIIYKHYAAYLLSMWNIIGNGHGCALPISAVDEDLRSIRNIIYLGVTAELVPVPDQIPITWGGDLISVNGSDLEDVAFVFVFPDGEHLSAAMLATPGSEYLLYWHQPFSSRAGIPDYLLWYNGGGLASGFFDMDWTFNTAFGVGF